MIMIDSLGAPSEVFRYKISQVQFKSMSRFHAFIKYISPDFVKELARNISSLV